MRGGHEASAGEHGGRGGHTSVPPLWVLSPHTARCTPAVPSRAAAPSTPTRPPSRAPPTPACSHLIALQVGFMATQSRTQLTTHLDSKHPKLKFEDIFPGFVDK